MRTRKQVRKLFGRGFQKRRAAQNEGDEAQDVADEMKKIAQLRRDFVTEFTNVEYVQRRKFHDR